MKFKDYLASITDPSGFFPLPHLRWIIKKNTRPTAREEAIAAEVIRQANPRENITGSFPWGQEEQLVLQQLWMNPDKVSDLYNGIAEWRDVPIDNADTLFTEQDGLPVPNAVNEPGAVVGDFRGRLREVLGEDFQ